MASSDNEAAPNDHTQGDHEAEDPQEEYQPKFNDGHFPAAMGTVATNISQDTTATQRENAENLFQFLKDPACVASTTSTMMTMQLSQHWSVPPTPPKSKSSMGLDLVHQSSAERHPSLEIS